MADHPQENELALYSTRDLDGGRLAFLAQHLNECGACRQRLAEFEYVQAMLPSVSGEPAANDLRDVRAAVIRAIQKQSKLRRTVTWALAAAASAALLVVFNGAQHRVREPEPVRPLVAAVEHGRGAERATSTPIQEVHGSLRAQRRTRPGLRSIALISKPGQVPLIKMTTSDPNVIILLPPDSPVDERTESND